MKELCILFNCKINNLAGVRTELVRTKARSEFTYKKCPWLGNAPFLVSGSLRAFFVCGIAFLRKCNRIAVKPARRSITGTWTGTAERLSADFILKGACFAYPEKTPTGGISVGTESAQSINVRAFLTEGMNLVFGKGKAKALEFLRLPGEKWTGAPRQLI